MRIMLKLVYILKEDSHPTLSSALMDGGMHAIDKIFNEVSVIILCCKFNQTLEAYIWS